MYEAGKSLGPIYGVFTQRQNMYAEHGTERNAGGCQQLVGD
jgi:hypothetical protein